MAETKNGGTIHSCASDDGRGTVLSESLMVPSCYVMSKSCMVEDPVVTGMSGPCGEVSVVTLSALWSDTPLCECGVSSGVKSYSEGGAFGVAEDVGRFEGMSTTACDSPHNMFVCPKPTKCDSVEVMVTVGSAGYSVSLYLEALPKSTKDGM